MARKAGTVSKSSALNKRKRTQSTTEKNEEPVSPSPKARKPAKAAEANVKKVKFDQETTQTTEENDVDQSIQHFLDAVARNPNRLKALMDNSDVDSTKSATEPTPQSGYVGQSFDPVDHSQKYTLISVLGPDVANKAYDENNELVKFHGLVVWGTVDSLESHKFKDMQAKAAKSCNNAFDIMAIPTCQMTPLKYTHEELLGQVDTTWQDERVQELMEGARRQSANAKLFFDQQKEARLRGETTPEMLREDLERMIKNQEKLEVEKQQLAQHIKELQLKLK